MLSGATFHECINTIYQFIKSFLEYKMSIFEEYGAFNVSLLQIILFFLRNTYWALRLRPVAYAN